MAQSPQHALVFRIMRLSRPSLTPEDPLRFSLGHDLSADGAAGGDPQLASALPASSYPFAGRLALGGSGGGGDAAAAGGLSGLLALPQSFGLVYLGESFQAYVTVCNYSDLPAANVRGID